MILPFIARTNLIYLAPIMVHLNFSKFSSFSRQARLKKFASIVYFYQPLH